MKGLLLSIVLVSALCSVLFSAPAGPNTAKSCCIKYRQKPVPRANVHSYYMTSSRCANSAAVVFIVKKRCHVCADPKSPWVKDLIDYLDRPLQS